MLSVDHEELIEAAASVDSAAAGLNHRDADPYLVVSDSTAAGSNDGRNEFGGSALEALLTLFHSNVAATVEGIVNSAGQCAQDLRAISVEIRAEDNRLAASTTP